MNSISLDYDEDDLYTRERINDSKCTTSKPNKKRHHTLRSPERNFNPTYELDTHMEVYKNRDLGVRPYEPGRERRDYDHDHGSKRSRKLGHYNDKYQRDKSENRYRHNRYFDERYNSKKFRKNRR